MSTILSTTRRYGWRGFVLVLTAMILTSCGWRGIANVPMPGGPGTGSDTMTVYVQMPDTLALNVNSRVRVADVFVGSVRAIELKNWIPTLTLKLQPGVKLPANAIARIGQTSLLGTQHVELDPPPNPSPSTTSPKPTPPAPRRASKSSTASSAEASSPAPPSW